MEIGKIFKDHLTAVREWDMLLEKKNAYLNSLQKKKAGRKLLLPVEQKVDRFFKKYFKNFKTSKKP